MYTLALVFFFYRTKTTVKHEELRSRKRVEYFLIFFSISSVTLVYLVQGMNRPTVVPSGMLSSMVNAAIPDISSASSGLYTIGKMIATYVLFLIALRARSQLQQS